MKLKVLRNGRLVNVLLHVPDCCRTRGSWKLEPFWTGRWHLSQRPYLNLSPEHPIRSTTAQRLRTYFLIEKWCIWLRCQTLRLHASLTGAWKWTTDGMILTGEPESTRKNLSRFHFVHHKAPTDGAWKKNRASAVWGQRITAWVMIMSYFFMS
jgi:hypothetical protein